MFYVIAVDLGVVIIACNTTAAPEVVSIARMDRRTDRAPTLNGTSHNAQPKGPLPSRFSALLICLCSFNFTLAVVTHPSVRDC